MKKLFKFEHILMLLLSMVGLFLRLNVINNIPTTQLYDFSTYYEVADNVFRGMGFTFKGFPIAFQGMGYSTILGVWFKIFNESSELLAKNLNVILSMATIYMFYYMMHQITKNKLLIMLSTIAVIFMPQHIMYVNAVGSEVLSVFLLVAVITLQVTKFNWKIKYPVLGVAVAILSLTKPFFIAYPLVLAMCEWLKEKDYKETLKLLAVVSVVMLIVISPWTYRNYKKFDRLIPISYNSGFNLYINNNEHNVHGGWQSFEDIYTTPELQEKIDVHLDIPLYNISDRVKVASDIELDFKPAAKKWIIENPIEFLKLGVIRIHSTYFYGAWDIENWTMNDYREELLEEEGVDEYKVTRQFNFMKSINDMCLLIVSVLGLLYIILHFKDIIVGIFKKSDKIDLFKSITFLNLSFVSLVYFVYEGQPRYNFLVLFLLIMAASEILTTYKSKS